MIITFMGSDCITQSSLDKYLRLFKVITNLCEEKNLSLTLRIGEASSCDNGIYNSLDGNKKYKIETYVPNFKFNKIQCVEEIRTDNQSKSEIKIRKILNQDQGIKLSKYGCAKGIWTQSTVIDKLVYLRNVYQLKGYSLFESSDLLYCWTPDGITNGKEASLKTGSIQHSLRLAYKFNIPIINSFKYSSTSSFIKDINQYL